MMTSQTQLSRVPAKTSGFDELRRLTGGHLDRKGFVHVPCPNCGKPAKAGHTHFAFNHLGGHCFVCGYSISIARLASTLNAGPVHFTRETIEAARPAPITYWWQNRPDIWKSFLNLPGFARDYYHRRGFTDASIDRWHLGYGVLPCSRVKVPRLILPVFEKGRLVALRGRAILEEDRDAKWLQAAGSRTVLFGAETLEPGKRVIVTEAPYSAILALQESSLVAAVAGTGGAACWRPEWTQRIRDSRPLWVLVWYDNDEAGQRNGVKVVNELLRAGLPATLYQWPSTAPAKADLADIIAADVA